MENKVKDLKRELIEIGKLLWDKNLAVACSGNLSCRIDQNSFLLTCHDSCVGLLTEKDFLVMDVKGQVLEVDNPSTESKLHAAIYANIPRAKAAIHTHTTYINSYFSVNEA